MSLTPIHFDLPSGDGSATTDSGDSYYEEDEQGIVGVRNDEDWGYPEPPVLQKMDEEDQACGGFDYEFIDQVLDSQKCAVCLLPMRDAVQTALCGHRFCRTCLIKTLRTKTIGNCPTCREPINSFHDFYRDIAWSRDISCLHVKCKMSERGCEWTGKVMHAEEHLINCAFGDVPCSDCNNEFQRRHMELHLLEQCPHRIVQCVYCKEDVPYHIKPEHEDELCTRFPIPCKNQCGLTNIPREEMDIHLKDQCPMTEVICPYREAGCEFEDKRAHLSAHIEASTDVHMQLLLTSLADLKQNKLPGLEEEIKTLKAENKELKKSQANLEQLLENYTATKRSPKVEGEELLLDDLRKLKPLRYRRK